VPEGWKLVPVKPTPAMLEGMAALDGYVLREKEVFPYQRYADYYEAMLAAAPSSEEGK